MTWRPTVWSGAIVLVLGLAVHNGLLSIVERLVATYPSVHDVLLERLPYVNFGRAGELYFALFLAIFAVMLFRDQRPDVGRVLTLLGLLYASRGIFLLLLPIGAPVGAPPLQDRFVLYPYAAHAFFPGGHVGLMVLMARLVRRPPWRRWLFLAAAVFAVGTILARTHYTADALGGALLAYAVAAWGRERILAPDETKG